MIDPADRLRGRTDAGTDDRGQLLLVGAIVTALVIVTVAVLVNTTIYTGSIAPQAPDIAGQEGERYERIVDRDLQRLSNEIDENSTAPGADQSDLAANVTRYSHRLSVIAAQESPAVVNVTFNETISNGPTQVADQTGGQIEDKNGNYAFDIVDDANASGVVGFSLELDASTSASAPQPIAIIVENPSTGDEWRLEFFKNPSTSDFRVREVTSNPSTTRTCNLALGGPDVTVNMTTVTNGMTTCDIEFGRNVDEPYSVSFDEGNKANGAEWSLTTRGNVDGNTFYPEDTGNQPYINPLVTDAAFNVIYQTPSITYNRTIQLDVGDPVAPESGHVFLYSDFEESNLGGTAWVAGNDGGTQGVVGLSSTTSYSGSTSAFHNGGALAATVAPSGNGTIETASTYDTTRYDAVVVEFWAQEGQPGGTDGGPEIGEEEALRVQYLNDSGDWVTAGTVEPFDQSGVEDDPRAFHRNVRIDDPDVLHPGFRMRFLMPADAQSDRWFVDDVALRGWVDR